MIQWSKRIYFGETMKKKHRKVIHAINNCRLVPGAYCIAYAQNPACLLEIISAAELMYPAYKRMEIHIVGLANGKEEACELVMDMLLELYQKTGEFKVREYFG